MTKKLSRYIALALVLIAVAFLAYALNHPETSFPWNNSITWLIYGLYGVLTAVFWIAPFGKNKRSGYLKRPQKVRQIFLTQIV